MKIIYQSSTLLLGLLLVFSGVSAQRFTQGVGIRVGDPVGISYKAYLSGNGAAELNFGTTSRNWHSSYYQDTFNDLDRYEGFTYTAHDVKYTVALQGRYLLHYSFPAYVEGRLDWYWGLGGQVRLSKVDYTYFDETNTFGTDTRTNFDLGPEGIIGVEYELLDYPVVSFGELSLMSEIVDKPLRFRLFVGLGVRYAF